jgi:hypothetical protein
MNSEETATRRQPTGDRRAILIALCGLDGAIQRVFKQPVVRSIRFIREKIPFDETEVKVIEFAGTFAGEADGGWRQIETRDRVSGPSPSANVVSAILRNKD